MPIYTESRTLFSRRSLIAAAALGVPAAVLAGCGQTPAQIFATLGNAQAEISAVWTAVKSFVPANASAAITTAINTEQTAVSAFLAIPAGANGIQAAEAVLKGLTPLLSLLPIARPTLADINLGLSLVEAFISGLPSVPAPATPNVGAAPITVIPAPIPIRVPVA